MARYIDADKLFRYVDEQAHLSKGKLAQYIRENKTSDVAEVRHGEWREKPNPWGQDGSHTYVCSTCNKQISVLGNLLPYCPHCGAKMDGGKAE